MGRLPLGFLQALGTILGGLLSISGSRMKKVSRVNIDITFPELSAKERRKLVHDSLMETGKTLLETCRYWTRSDTVCLSDIDSVEDHQLNRIRARHPNRPLLVIVPHLGNWELLNHFLGRHYPVTHMYLPAKSRHLDRLILGWRRASSNRFVSANLAGVRQQRADLRAGKHIGFMPDQEPDIDAGLFVDFFGIKALTGPLVPRLCQTLEAIPVILSCLRQSRQPGSRFSVRLTPLDLKEGSTESLAQQINDFMEAEIRRNPAQYLWSYKRFKTRPPGDPELYETLDSGLVVHLQQLLIIALLKLTARFPLALTRQLGVVLGTIASFLPVKVRKITMTNLGLCFPNMPVRERKILARQSLLASGQTAMETGALWYQPDTWFNRHIQVVESHPVLSQSDTRQGCILLIPPIGNREAAIRFLFTQFRLNEYYHPHPRPAVDRLIRSAREQLAISLYNHTSQSVDDLSGKLANGDAVLVCPDQQPRLHGGLFIPFFNHPALTTLAIPAMARNSGANVFFAWALSAKEGFQMHFRSALHGEPDQKSAETRIDNTSEHTGNAAIADLPDETLLTRINHGLEQIILAQPAQYRWSDKRFNIQPRGMPKPYRKHR